ncbi:Respiratory supercomplex factor 1, mitochondrial [Coemansia sp. RSA 2336]|nr:Respiratory supercomplex factor 1, mitochondrial [Coemansia sp. RSA 2336]
MSGPVKSITGRLKEEPLVSVGVAGTIGALLYATWGIHRNNTKQTQWGMRGRVIMQGLTIAALVGYSLFRNKDAPKAPASKGDIRPIDWDKLEREAREAEAKDSEAKNQKPTSPALEKLKARLQKEKEAEAKSVFAKEEPKK